MEGFDNSNYFTYLISKIKRDRYCRKIEHMTIDEKKRLIDDFFFMCSANHVVWDNPQTFNDKMQSFKLFGDMNEVSKYADKYRVREYVAERIGEEHLIPLLGVWENARDIDFDSLPEQFVMKANNSCADVQIIKDKSELTRKDIRALRRHFDFHMHCKYGYETGEFQYAPIKPCVVAEKYIVAEENDLPDYKFFCFDGVPRMVWMDKYRFGDRRRNIYDADWNPLPWTVGHFYFPTDEEVPKPAEFEEMKEIASKLSKGHKQVRIDLYLVDGIVYFGEMTFTSASGVVAINPPEANLTLGSYWNL